jgi:hypothetical protein
MQASHSTILSDTVTRVSLPGKSSLLRASSREACSRSYQPECSNDTKHRTRNGDDTTIPSCAVAPVRLSFYLSDSPPAPPGHHVSRRLPGLRLRSPSWPPSSSVLLPSSISRVRPSTYVPPSAAQAG